MARLHFRDVNIHGGTFDLVAERITIGRGSQNDLCILDPSVAEVHCELWVYGPEVILRDLGTRCGTYVARNRLENGQCQVKNGQEISIGSVVAWLELDPPEPDRSDDSVVCERPVLKPEGQMEKTTVSCRSNAELSSPPIRVTPPAVLVLAAILVLLGALYLLALGNR
jgi:pSer/pThr/pTyr-binding forkhead associated (FHA) protein